MDDTDTLARTLFGEAEVNDRADVIAVAAVVLNRVAKGRWPNNIAMVCKQPAQFSCWNADNPRLGRIVTVNRRDPWFKVCWDIAEQAVAGTLADPTNGATHYFASYIDVPKWARGKIPCYSTPAGKYTHLFFNDIDTPKPRVATAAKVTAGATATAGVTGAVAESGLLQNIRDAGDVAMTLQPVFWLMGSIGPLLPYLLTAAAVGLAGYLLWAWWRDRRDGGRT